MKLRELFEATSTETVTVFFSDGTIKSITDVPVSVLNRGSFEQDLKTKIEKRFPNKEYVRFTKQTEFTPNDQEKVSMENVSNLWRLIWDEITKQGENKHFPDDVSYSYTTPDGKSKSIDNVKKEFDITRYWNTEDPKSDQFGEINGEGWPVSMADFDDLKSKIIPAVGAEDYIVMGQLPQEAQEPGATPRITIAPATFQFKREIQGASS